MATKAPSTIGRMGVATITWLPYSLITTICLLALMLRLTHILTGYATAHISQDTMPVWTFMAFGLARPPQPGHNHSYVMLPDDEFYSNWTLRVDSGYTKTVIRNECKLINVSPTAASYYINCVEVQIVATRMGDRRAATMYLGLAANSRC